ncbi:MAG: HNH endonuclease family protein, partial [Arcobacter sp.]
TVSKTDYRRIEHNLPQPPSEDCWHTEIVGLSEFEVQKLTNSLGNLVPLSSAKNSKLQNYCFEIKKNGKDGTFTGYKNGSYSEQKINEKINWGIYEIHERGIDLLTFMAEHWDIKELNESKQKEFLFLDNIFNNK